VGFYARLLRESRSAGLSAGAVRVSVSVFDESRAEALERDVVGALSRRHPDVRDRKERLLVSGLGSERFVACFDEP
jgi:hypothetical protein